MMPSKSQGSSNETQGRRKHLTKLEIKTGRSHSRHAKWVRMSRGTPWRWGGGQPIERWRGVRTDFDLVRMKRDRRTKGERPDVLASALAKAAAVEENIAVGWRRGYDAGYAVGPAG